MRYASTRGGSDPVLLSEAVERGLAPDGGLYVPERFPRLAPGDLSPAVELPQLAARLLAPFFAEDPLADALPEICREAFTFPVPLRPLEDGTAVLELFHGPTAAFKDVGARFLAATLSRVARRQDRLLTVLTATSGDTGGAVAAAFHGRPGVEVVILFPQGMISARQEKQLTAWGGNVRAMAVLGDFDACQRMAKGALAHPDLYPHRLLTSANSINLGRLLPQMVYYAAAALQYRERHGAEAGFVVPSGNLGNAVAALWARRVGVPLREVVLATNANRAIRDFMDGGAWEPRPTVATLATAMDVGNPSNMERALHLFGGEGEARRNLRAFLVSDDEIREQIRSGTERGEVWDPHTATAIAARQRLGGSDWVVVATAHPAKFEHVVEPLIGREIPVPPALARMLDRPSEATEIAPTLDALLAELAPAAEG